MAGDDSGPGVRRERDDSVSGLSQDGAGFLTTQDPLREEEGEEVEARGFIANEFTVNVKAD